MAEERARTQSRGNGRSRAGTDTSNGGGAGGVAGSQARRMQEPVDESGGPLPGRENSSPVSGAGAAPMGASQAGKARLGNEPVDKEAMIQEEIRIKAYERYVMRGGAPGSPEDDWSEAEKEVRGKLWSRGSGTEPGV